ncbi:hypothetical protein QYE76_035670 [Lolium multiflorum]|uniref:F-box domain-containing protein n=1 Tax=Lolium multiflorum TaxID=4521 RepID=A0AAD8R1A0_LOLMU|nr:hypothetical protein QYE76_035670 [Lolium multiflorum]
MESASKRAKVSAAETTGVALPPDMVEEILMRVPARSLYRLREVCRSWRSVVSEPSFVKAHAALHPPFILTLDGAGHHIEMVDLSGNAVKQIDVPAAVEEGMLPAQPGPLYLFRTINCNRVRVVDPDAGAISALPVDDLDPPVGQWMGHWPQPCYTLFRDFSTGHRKVLRIATLDGPRIEQLCHVLTLDGGNDGKQRRWRPAPSPPVCITTDPGVAGVIVQRFVCFLPDKIYPNFIADQCPRDARTADLRKSVALFDLKTKEWRPATIRGPSAIDTGTGKCRVKLVKLSNMLVMMHYDSMRPIVDLWFAVDLEAGENFIQILSRFERDHVHIWEMKWRLQDPIVDVAL